MALVFAQTGMQVLGELLTNNETVSDLRLHLYQNDLDPTSSNVLGDFTEATFTGYASVLLTAANWTVTTASTTVHEYNTSVPFTSSAGSQNQDIYGYYVTKESDGSLVYSERFSDAPNNIANNGDAINMTPRITFTNSSGA